MERALRNNIKTIYWMIFFQSAMIVTAVFVPLLQRHGLSMSEVLQTQALFAFVVAISEVPSGYLADLWGRKRTIILGQAFIAISFIWLLFSDDFVDFLVYEALIGFGISMGSGADLALLYDSQTALNKYTDKPLANHGNHIARLVTIEGYAGAIAAIAASLLTVWSLDWVLLGQSVVGMLGFAFALRLVEAPRQISVASHKENIHKVINVMFNRALVLWTALAIIVFGLMGLYAFWLFQKYWEAQGIPVEWFGYIWAIHCIVRGFTAHFSHQVEKHFGWREILILSSILPLCGFLGMSLFSGIPGLLFGLAFPVCRGLTLVIFYDALNKRVDADFRATVNSLVSLGMRSIFIITGPLLGYMVDSQGVEVSLMVMALLFLPGMLVVLIPLAKCITQEAEGSELVHER